MDDFDDFFHDTYPRARNVAYRILGDRPAAEDAAAEAFTRALVSWSRLASSEHREVWVLRATMNVAVDLRRRRHPDVFPSEPIEDAGEATVLRLTMAQALAALPRRQREVIGLRYLVGMTESQVADSLGLSVGSVKRHGHRATERLRQRLGEDWRPGVADVAT